MSALTTPTEHYTENTLFKVYDVLRAAGLGESQAREAINEMQNQGILFRERVPVPENKSKLQMRAARGRTPYSEDEDE